MPLVKIKDKFQVTIPASIRKAIELDIGDLLEVNDQVTPSSQAV
ncbi:MAG: AbrB/MazE/SpoVT family DNA-binding domain-containing protein [Desulfobacterales bacterium]|nr:AbrB/MazE/SpoVT family DNA-binding domain-containing protein [Desulfobacterales bacterium]